MHLGVEDIFTLYDGERIVNAKIYAASTTIGKRSGGFYFKTNFEREFDAKSGDTEADYTYDYDPHLGSGLLYGIMCKSGADVDALGFLFLRNFDKVLLSNVEYNLDNLPKEVKSRVEVIEYDNSNGTETQTYTISGSRVLVTQYEWTWANSTNYNNGHEYDVSVKAPVPIAEIGVNGAYKISTTLSAIDNHKKSELETVTRNYIFPLKIPAGKKGYAEVNTSEFKFLLPYNGELTYTLDTGYKAKRKVRGTLDGVLSANVMIEVYNTN